MSNTIASGLFAIIGITFGWLLSEVGAGWRGYAERRRAEQLQQLRLIPLTVTAKGPRSALPQIDVLVDRTQALRNRFAEMSRADIADRPARFPDECKEIAKIAEDLVSHS